MALKKTSFYHTRKKIMPNNLQAAELLGVDVNEIERMDKEGAPIMAERLLMLWDKKHVGLPGWENWNFSQGTLRHKGQQWRPDNILHSRLEIDKAEQLRREIKQLHSVNGLLKITRNLILKNYPKIRI
jgi:hypothetical protein